MTKDDDVRVTAAVESFELPFDPLVLLLVLRNIRIEANDESVAITERIGCRTGQAPRRPFLRNERRNRIEIVFEAFGRRCSFMISRHQKVRHSTLGRQAIDERHETYIPLLDLTSILDGVARLENEPHRIFRAFELFDLCQHRIDDQRVFVLERCSVTPPPYTMNEYFVTPFDSASEGRGVVGAVIAVTRSLSWAPALTGRPKVELTTRRKTANNPTEV